MLLLAKSFERFLLSLVVCFYLLILVSVSAFFNISIMHYLCFVDTHDQVFGCAVVLGTFVCVYTSIIFMCIYIYIYIYIYTMHGDYYYTAQTKPNLSVNLHRPSDRSHVYFVVPFRHAFAWHMPKKKNPSRREGLFYLLPSFFTITSST